MAVVLQDVHIPKKSGKGSLKVIHSVQELNHLYWVEEQKYNYFTTKINWAENMLTASKIKEERMLAKLDQN